MPQMEMSRYSRRWCIDRINRFILLTNKLIKPHLLPGILDLPFSLGWVVPFLHRHLNSLLSNLHKSLTQPKLSMERNIFKQNTLRPRGRRARPPRYHLVSSAVTKLIHSSPRPTSGFRYNGLTRTVLLPKKGFFGGEIRRHSAAATVGAFSQ